MRGPQMKAYTKLTLRNPKRSLDDISPGKEGPERESGSLTLPPKLSQLPRPKSDAAMQGVVAEITLLQMCHARQR